MRYDCRPMTLCSGDCCGADDGCVHRGIHIFKKQREVASVVRQGMQPETESAWHACWCRQAGGVNALDATHTFTKRKTEAAVMSLVTRYSGVRHRIVHDKEEVCVINKEISPVRPVKLRSTLQRLEMDPSHTSTGWLVLLFAGG